MKLSKAINTFHIGLSLYIAGGWMLSYIHNRILLLLIPLMYVNWLIDDNKCIFTRLEQHYKGVKDDKYQGIYTGYFGRVRPQRDDLFMKALKSKMYLFPSIFVKNSSLLRFWKINF